MFIAEYANKGYESHAEKRDRKLLLLHKEICEIISELSRKGSTLVAMKLFFNDRGRAKLEIGLGRGKNSMTSAKPLRIVTGTATGNAF